MVLLSQYHQYIFLTNFRIYQTTFNVGCNFVTARFDYTTAATSDTYWAGGQVGVRTKNVTRLHKDISVTSSLLCTKGGAWHFNDSTVIPNYNAQSGTPFWLERQTSPRRSCHTIDAGGAQVESHLQTYTHRRQANPVLCHWHGSLVGTDNAGHKSRLLAGQNWQDRSSSTLYSSFFVGKCASFNWCVTQLNKPHITILLQFSSRGVVL